MLLDLHAFETKSETVTTLPPRRLSAGERLLRELRELAGPLAEIVSHAEAPWASITFTGARHRLLCATGVALAGAEDAELPLPGHFVADLCWRTEANGVVIEALTIEAE